MQGRLQEGERSSVGPARDVETELQNGKGIVDPAPLEEALDHFDTLWEQMSGWEQERFVRALISEVRYDGTNGGVTINFRSEGLRDLCEGEVASI